MQYDFPVIVLTTVICTVALFTSIYLLDRISITTRKVWLSVAGIATGFGIWATYFIAMLTYSPRIQNSYNTTLVLVSLSAAILLAILSFAVTSGLPQRLGREKGGLLVGCGIAIMHYSGMAAFEVPGRILWNPSMMVISIVLGSLFSTFALPTELRKKTHRTITSGTLLLTLVICNHHFAAMATADLIQDQSITVSTNATPVYWLAITVTIACLLIFLLTLIVFTLNVWNLHLATREMEHLNSLANAAFEGLLVYEDGVITMANTSLAKLAGCSAEELTHRDLSLIFPDAMARNWLEEKPCIALKTMLHPLSGEDSIVVEATSRSVIYARKLQKIVAIRDLRDHIKAERDIHYLFNHDTLTGLINRKAFNQELEKLLQDHGANGRLCGKHLAVLCLDLDRFKEVNDLFGHAAGDGLLQTVARRAQQTLRSDQLMARLGGDEFAIIAPGLSDPQQAERIAQKLFSVFADANRSASTSCATISINIGIAIFPQHGHNSPSIMRCAAKALCQAKADGRGVYRFFDVTLDQQMRDRQRLEHDLRLAIANQELSLVYQPLVQTKSREVVGFETLLRWKHQKRGLVPPSVFIPIAEECGQILQIGEWVLHQACKEASSWKRHLNIAVNVSAVQLHSPQFVQITREILKQTKLPPSRLELEITETALIRDPDIALSTIRQLKEIGVRIAMDDFGTGYSSLSHLLTFPFDKIKIDGSFIKSVHVNPRAATIVRAVLELGRGLELPVLAEGVETEEELAFLSAESCEEVQGYLFGKPESIERYLQLTTRALQVPRYTGPIAPKGPVREDTCHHTKLLKQDADLEHQIIRV